ncbi:unnamed protein product [Dicrocoelium dendriticum]|nr:unnamed protein product [Dicrocoelium dendriticum]
MPSEDLNCNYDPTEIDATSLTLIPTVTSTTYTVMDNQRIYSSCMTDEQDDGPSVMECSCNNNQILCGPSRPVADVTPVSYRPVEHNIWTEGLQWLPEELLVIRSDILPQPTSETKPKAKPRVLKNHPPIRTCSKTTTDVLENRKPTSVLSPATQLSQGVGTPRDFQRSNGNQRSVPEYVKECGLSRTNPERMSPTKPPANPMKSIALTDQRVKTSCNVDPGRVNRIQEFVKKYFPGQSEKIFMDKVVLGISDLKTNTVKPSNAKQLMEANDSKINVQTTHLKPPLSKCVKTVTKGSSLPVKCRSRLEQTDGGLSSSTLDVASKASGRKNRFVVAPTQGESKNEISGIKAKSARPSSKIRMEKGDHVWNSNSALHSRLVETQGTKTQSCDRVSSRMPARVGSLPPRSIRKAQVENPNSTQLDSLNLLAAYHRRLERKQELRARTSAPKNTTEKTRQPQTSGGDDKPSTSILNAGFNTIAHKLRRVNIVREELNRLQEQLKELRTYNNLGRLYYLADAFISTLCTQIAPYVLVSVMVFPDGLIRFYAWQLTDQ